MVLSELKYAQGLMTHWQSLQLLECTAAGLLTATFEQPMKSSGLSNLACLRLIDICEKK